MLTIGFSGGLDQVFQNRDYLFAPGTFHDAAAVLVEDGEVVAAIEEERINRIKHSRKGAINAIRYCLQARGISLSDIDALIYYGSDEGLNLWTRHLFYGNCDARPVTTHRQLIHEFLQHGLGEDIEDSKLKFVNHHLAHAISAYAQSGLSDSLVLTIDGGGDGLSGSVTQWHGTNYQLLAAYDGSKSLGTYYDRVIAIIGYGFTEEFKVMGLAAYGNPACFRQAFESTYTLLPYGDYTFNWHLIENLYPLLSVRKRGESILVEHKDIAAALQETLERVVFHVLSFYRQATGMPNLCMAGGVAHNSTLNGKLLYSGLFQDIFVHPASKDSGCAIGAALYPFMYPFMNMDQTMSSETMSSPARIEHVFWGTYVGENDEIGATLERWKPFIEISHEDQIAERSATLLADGRVIGWVQGRSEFGPRSLGNRSILADPRPASNKDLINEMVKKRESYRPFAPVVLEEYASEYFEIPNEGMTFPFMSFTVKVRLKWCKLLGATTHVDDTARVQTVSRKINPRLWELIEAFRQITGVAVLLNTSFNNNEEPIVDSVDDAVACFLTTGLQHLVAENYLVAKNDYGRQHILQLYATLPAYARLTETISVGGNGNYDIRHCIANSYGDDTVAISDQVYRLLGSGDQQTLAALLESEQKEGATIAEEFWSLWERRVVVVHP